MAGLRREHPAAYAQLADEVEQALALAAARIDPAALGAVDTFRFEEAALLGYVARQITAREYVAALALVEACDRSF